MSMDKDNNDNKRTQREAKVYRPETGAKKIVVGHRGGTAFIHERRTASGTVQTRYNYGPRGQRETNKD